MESTVEEKPQTITLNSEQQHVVDAVISGKKSVFITGSAGVGKSFLVKEICRRLTCEGRFYSLVAPTGVAAVNIGGTTIHRFAGLRPAVRTFADYIRTRSYRPSNWKNIDVLIIDEISMLHPDTFELLGEIAKYHRQSPLPFGGLQLVLIGDLLQLPYVPERDECKRSRKYIFLTDTWKSLGITVFLLTKVVRQNEVMFVQALNDLRLGIVSDVVTEVISRCCNNKRIRGKHYVKLCATNILKDTENATQLEKLTTPAIYYRAQDVGDVKLLAGCLAAETLVLKEGCPVMLLRNMPEFELCNGSIGVIVGFVDGFPIVKFNNGRQVRIEREKWEIVEKHKGGFKVLASRRQVALAVAYSLSQHKSQGLTIDFLEVDCSRIFTTGQLYTALSRASTMKGLRLKNFDMSALIVDKVIAEFYQSALMGSTVLGDVVG